MNNFEDMKTSSSVFYVVAVKDELTQAYLQPTFGQSIDELKRIFQTQIKTVPIWRENPSDFSLYLLGTFNQETGVFISCIEKIMSGYIAKQNMEEKQ